MLENILKISDCMTPGLLYCLFEGHFCMMWLVEVPGERIVLSLENEFSYLRDRGISGNLKLHFT